MEKRMKTKIGILGLMALVCASFMLDGCSDDILMDTTEGYFRMIMGFPYECNVSAEAGGMDIGLTGTKTEAVIPIVFIGNIEDDIYKTRYTWEEWHSEGEAYLPDLQYTADGYDSYPNTLDYTYKFKWATFSTVKEPGSENGLLRVTYEANPYNVGRQIVAYLKNEDTGTLLLRQMANPDGIDPPGEPLEEWEYYTGPYTPPTD